MLTREMEQRKTSAHGLALVHGVAVDVGVGQPQHDVAVEQAVQRQPLQQPCPHQAVPGQDVAQQLHTNNTHNMTCLHGAMEQSDRTGIAPL